MEIVFSFVNYFLLLVLNAVSFNDHMCELPFSIKNKTQRYYVFTKFIDTITKAFISNA